ncbi:hypothetical protein [Rhizobium sp. K7/93]
MTRYVIAFTAAAALTAIAAVPAFPQVVVYDGEPSDPYSVDGNTESNFRTWIRHHDDQNRWLADS